MLNLVYNRTSMNAAVKFLRANNPTAAKYSELDLVARIEGMMVDMVDGQYTTAGTLGFIIVYNGNTAENTHDFEIYVDAGVNKGYEEVTVSMNEYS